MRRHCLLCLLLIPLLMAPAALAQSDDSGECTLPVAVSSPLLALQSEATPEATPCVYPAGTDIASYVALMDAALLTGHYANLFDTYTAILRNVIPVTPDAFEQVLAGYQAQVDASTEDLNGLMGLGFAQWWLSDYAGAVATYDRLLELLPDNLYATLFRGSSRLFNEEFESGEADIARALELAPNSPDAHFIAADAYLYALGDTARAQEQAALARDLGLVTPRVNAILATAYMEQGEIALATDLFAEHLTGVTTEFADAGPLEPGAALTLDFVPGRTYRVAVAAEAGETLSLLASSETGVDTLAVLFDPDGAAVTSNDDTDGLNAGIVYDAETAGTYTLVIGTFEGAGLGEVVLTRG